MKKIGVEKKKDEEYRILLLKARYTYNNTDKEFVAKFQDIVVLYSSIQNKVVQYEDIPGFNKDILKMDLKEYEQFYKDLCIWNSKQREVAAPKSPEQKEEIKEPKIEVKAKGEEKKEEKMTIQGAEIVPSLELPKSQVKQAGEEKALPSIIKEEKLEVKEQKIIESVALSQEQKSSVSVVESSVSEAGSGNSIYEPSSSFVMKSEESSIKKP